MPRLPGVQKLPKKVWKNSLTPLQHFLRLFLMKLKYILTLSILLFSGAVLAAQGTQSETELDHWEDLRNLLQEDEDILLLDVRSLPEYEQGHIPGATLLPHVNIPGNPPQVPKDTRIIVYCRSGNRSAQALRMLTEQGFSNVSDFGGIYRWEGELNRGSAP
ncbi:Rhodanese-like domain protein [Salinispira pacifica]|uniref:Rhodanese-like domain protein n=2 Tax=Salinispira pacifica TaxID=1307761 RepID=V5WJ70_9SPIO|nr:Rhodanese-like domain protein [Salinispira pacifica]